MERRDSGYEIRLLRLMIERKRFWILFYLFFFAIVFFLTFFFKLNNVITGLFDWKNFIL